MMRTAYLVLALLFSFVGQSHAAAAVGQATVVQVRVDNNGYGMVFFDKLLGGTPASCAISAYNNALAFNTNNPGGKSILALALLAKTSGTPLAMVYGTGSCSIYGGSAEDWFYGQ